jgi:hypothetical protein
MPSAMENQQEDDKLINDLFLDHKSHDLLKTHQIEYQKYLKKDKRRKIATFLFLAVTLSSGVLFYYLNNDRKPEFNKDSKLQLENDAAQVELNNKDTSKSENQTPLINQVIVQSDKEDDKLDDIEKDKKRIVPNVKSYVEDKSLKTKKETKPIVDPNIGKTCNKRFEDFGINATEQSIENPVRDIILEKANAKAKIVTIKMNGEAQKLPIKDLTDGKYVFEITDETGCKYMKILKINQLSWKE